MGKEQTKFLRVVPFGHKRVIRNERKFGWELVDYVKHTTTTTTTEYEGKVHDNGDVTFTPHTSTSSKTRMELYFVRDKDRIANLGSVYLVEMWFNLIFLIRRIIGFFVPIVGVAFLLVALMGGSMDEVGKMVGTAFFVIILSWLAGIILEDILAAIGKKVLKTNY